MKHKSKHPSSLRDPCPATKRTAYCGIVVDNVKVINQWKTVTCKECLELRIDHENITNFNAALKLRKRTRSNYSS